MADDILKKYAQFLDSDPQACEEKKKDPCTGENCTEEMCSSCKDESSCGASKAEPAGPDCCGCGFN